MKQHAKKSTDSRRSCSYDQYRIVFGNLRNASCPEACGQDITHKQGLFIGHAIGNVVQSLICKRYTNILGLSTIDAASQRPTTIRVCAIVYITVLAEETLSTEGLYVYGYSIAWLYIGYLRANFFNHSHHFVTHGNAWNGTRYTAMLDMQVTSANTAHCYTNNGIGRFNKFRLRFLHQSELSFFYVCVC